MGRGQLTPPRQLTLALWALLAACVCPPGAARAHLIDEVAESIVVDLHSGDRQHFELAYVLHGSQVESYYRQARELGLADGTGDQDFARRLSLAFRYDDCAAEPLPGARVDMPQKGFVAWRLKLRCAAPMRSLRLRRVDYDRRKTRTTLYISVRLGDEAPRRLLVPPRLADMVLPLVTGGSSQDAQPDQMPRHGKGPGGSTVETPATDRPGRLPADPIDLSRLPPAGQPPMPTWRRVLTPPPTGILLAWVEEGAAHLIGGLDHLLFLVAIAIAALTWRGLLLAVVAFSAGHMCAMALTLALDLPAVAAVEVGIALSICWSGWRARRPQRLRAIWTVVGAGLFGLVHGVGFGTGLKSLVGGTEGILWPIVTFGLGLDLAQSLWAAAVMALWTPIRRRQGASSAFWPERTQRGAAWALVAAGAALAVYAATRGG